MNYWRDLSKEENRVGLITATLGRRRTVEAILKNHPFFSTL